MTPKEIQSLPYVIFRLYDEDPDNVGENKKFEFETEHLIRTQIASVPVEYDDSYQEHYQDYIENIVNSQNRFSVAFTQALIGSVIIVVSVASIIITYGASSAGNIGPAMAFMSYVMLTDMAISGLTTLSNGLIMFYNLGSDDPEQHLDYVQGNLGIRNAIAMCFYFIYLSINYNQNGNELCSEKLDAFRKAIRDFDFFAFMTSENNIVSMFINELLNTGFTIASFVIASSIDKYLFSFIPTYIKSKNSAKVLLSNDDYINLLKDFGFIDSSGNLIEMTLESGDDFLFYSRLHFMLRGEYTETVDLGLRYLYQKAASKALNEAIRAQTSFFQKMVNSIFKCSARIQKISQDVLYGIGFDSMIPYFDQLLEYLGEKGLVGAIFRDILSYTVRYIDNFVVMWLYGGTPVGVVMGLFAEGTLTRF